MSEFCGWPFSTIWMVRCWRMRWPSRQARRVHAYTAPSLACVWPGPTTNSRERRSSVPEQQTTQQRRLSNERALYRYTRAFERGDIGTIAAILQEASQNGELEGMIYEMHNLYQLEDPLQKQHLPSAQEDHHQEVHLPGQLLPISHAR